MTRRPDQAGDAHAVVPEEFADLADRVGRYLSAQTLDPAVRARHLHHLRELAAAQALEKPVRAARGPRWRGLGRRVVGTAAASLAAVTLSTSAVAAASQTALPGEPLYGTKRLVEKVQLAVALTPEGDVAVLMDQAQRRALEAIALRERGADPALVDATLLDLQQQLQQAEVASAGDQQLQQQLAVAAEVVMERLQVLGGQMPESEQEGSGAYKAAVQAARASSLNRPDPAADQPEPAGGAGESAGPSVSQPPEGAFAGAGPAAGTASASDPADGGPPGPEGGPQQGEPVEPADSDPPEPDPGPDPDPGPGTGTGVEEPASDPPPDPSDDPSRPSDYNSSPPEEPDEPVEDPGDAGGESEDTESEQAPASYQSETGTPQVAPETSTSTSRRTSGGTEYGGVELTPPPH